MSHSTTCTPNRPWYCPDALVEDYRVVATNGGDLKMLRALKIARSIIVNIGIIAVTLYSLIGTGADATLIGSLGLITLGLYNGVEAADYAALARGFAEAKTEAESGNEQD